jgi:hypothetical protein
MKKVFLVVALALLIGGMAMASKTDNNGQNGQNVPMCTDTGTDQTCELCESNAECTAAGFGDVCCLCEGSDKIGRCVGSENACGCPVLG